MKMKQSDIWNQHTKDNTVDDIIAGIKSPCIFQTELASYINGLCCNMDMASVGGGVKRKVIEVGCELGVTSFLLDYSSRCFLDLNENAIRLIEQAHAKVCPDKIEDMMLVADMFHMPFEDGTFDVTFNAGVLEHYSAQERTVAIREMARVTKKGGSVIVAIPNHYCYVYRLAYLLGIFLDKLHIRRWPYPTEYKIYDMRDEIHNAGLELEERIIMSRGSIWNWWGSKWFFPLKMILRVIDKVKPSEGYLTVLRMVIK